MFAQLLNWLLTAIGPASQPFAGGDTSGVVGLVVLKQPRVGSTWVKKELNSLPGVHMEFEPLTDMAASTCNSNFTTGVLGQLMREPLRCLNGKSKAKPCYWTHANCDRDRLLSLAGRATDKNGSAVSGFLLNHIYVPAAQWGVLLAERSRAKLIILRRTNLMKRTVSNMLRVEEKAKTNTTINSTSPSHAAALPRRHRLDASQLYARARQSLRSFVRLPPPLSFYDEAHYLLLYEDLQTHRLQVLASVLAWLGKASLIPHFQLEAESTHWAKAPESLCASLTNCDELRARLRDSPCLLAQLESESPTAWTLPVTRPNSITRPVAPKAKATAGAAEPSALYEAAPRLAPTGQCTPLQPPSMGSCWRRKPAELTSGELLPQSDLQGHESSAERLQGADAGALRAQPAPAPAPSPPAVCNRAQRHAIQKLAARRGRRLGRRLAAKSYAALTASAPAAPALSAGPRPASAASGNWTAMYGWRTRLVKMGNATAGTFAISARSTLMMS